MYRTAATILSATLIAASLQIVAPPASAQIGSIFSNSPPRPPAAVRGNGQNPDDAVQEPDEEDVPELPQGRLLPTPTRPLPPGQGAPPPGAVQSQPLAPPPVTAPPQPGVASNPPGPNPLPGLPPGQKQPRGNPVQSPATLQPGDEIVTEPPAVKIANKKAVFSGLDKITGRIIKFDADIGETVQFGALRVKTDACYTRPATEAANTDAFVEVDEITLQNEVKRIFSGWMFASSPGLHAVEHPIYDVWLTDCKSPIDQPVTAQSDVPKPAQVPAQPQQQRRRATTSNNAPPVQRPVQPAQSGLPPPGFAR
ncbi:MAG: DUF2155 domain-containing protein [Xanthobacteraceae bacterium]|nr:DUF2155 domain-containing protein [Xanthobacteraceae bacterium]